MNAHLTIYRSHGPAWSPAVRWILSNAKLTGFDLGSKLGVLSSFAGVPKGADTAIQTFSPTVRIAPEGIRADNLNVVVPPSGSLTGNGTVGSDHALDFKMVAHLSMSASPLGGVASLIAGGGQKGATAAFRSRFRVRRRIRCLCRTWRERQRVAKGIICDASEMGIPKGHKTSGGRARRAIWGKRRSPDEPLCGFLRKLHGLESLRIAARRSCRCAAAVLRSLPPTGRIKNCYRIQLGSCCEETQPRSPQNAVRAVSPRGEEGRRRQAHRRQGGHQRHHARRRLGLDRRALRNRRIAGQPVPRGTAKCFWSPRAPWDWERSGWRCARGPRAWS